MNIKRRILVYGENDECGAVTTTLNELKFFKNKEYKFCCVNDLEELQLKMVEFSPSLVIIIKDGAIGMEGVYAAKRANPDVSLFWFSNDGDFAMQSHRLECEYFAVKPVTKDKVEHALNRCAHLGIIR